MQFQWFLFHKSWDKYKNTNIAIMQSLIYTRDTDEYNCFISSCEGAQDTFITWKAWI